MYLSFIDELYSSATYRDAESPYFWWAFTVGPNPFFFAQDALYDEVVRTAALEQRSILQNDWLRRKNIRAFS